MNVLFVEQSPRFIGGSERLSLSLCTFLSGRGHATYLLHEEDGDMVPAYAAVTRAIVRAPVRPLAIRRPLEVAASLRHLRRLLRQHRIDVIFSSQLGYVSLLALARRLWGVPTVFHLGLVMSFSSPLFRRALPRVAAGVVPSEPMRRSWLALGWPAAGLRVVPNGVDTARFRPAGDRTALRTELGLPNDRPVVAYLGRLVEEKGVFTLVRAAGLLPPRGVPFHLLMIGSAPQDQRARLAALAAKAGLTPSTFSLLPPTDRAERYYAAADVVVVPSEWDEPFGLAVIEAMAAGTPPIVSDAGILPEIAGPEQADGVFPQGDAAALADRLQFLLGHANVRAARAAAGLARVRARYDLARCGEAYERVLAEAIASASSPSP